MPMGKMTSCINVIASIVLLLSYSNTLNARPPNQSIEQQVSSTARILRSLGYLAEEHQVETQNGSYSLNLIKAENPLINYSQSGIIELEPLLFVHGIFVNANSFLMNIKGVKPKNYTAYDINSMSVAELEELLRNDPSSQSLVYTALNCGYVVWLLNRRPTLVSFSRKSSNNNLIKSNLVAGANRTKRETKLEDPQNSEKGVGFEYWGFSLDEQAFYDIPEIIHYILRKTAKKKLTYVGHSAGSALLLMSLTRKPELADKIFKAILWAPALYLKGDFRFVVREFLLHISPILSRINAPIPPPYLVESLDSLVGLVCNSELAQLTICDPLLDVVIGTGDTQTMVQNYNYQTKFFDMISAHEGAQLLQSTAKGKMHFFEYPTETQNIMAYGQPKPPIYDVSKIRLKTMSFWLGNTDLVVPIADVDEIIEDVSVPVDRRVIEGPKVRFNHNAFYIHENISSLLIIPCMKTIATR